MNSNGSGLYVTLDKEAVAGLAGRPGNSTSWSPTRDRRAHRAQRDLSGTVSDEAKRCTFADGLRGRHVLLGLVAFFGVILR